MLRTLFHGIRRIYQPLGGQLGASKWRGVIGVTDQCLRSQHTKSQDSTDYADYVVIDFSNKEYDEKSSDGLDIDSISPVLQKKPEFVYLERIQERHYWGRIRSYMRQLGYKGHLEDMRQGRGKGVFIREDVAQLVKPYNGTVYRSRRPNPF